MTTRLRTPSHWHTVSNLRCAPVGRSHYHRLIKTLPGGPYYTVAELAWLIERTAKTVKEWIRHQKIERGGKYIEVYGQLVWLYTIDDVERYREFAESQ